jgi:hypothetical protein
MEQQEVKDQVTKAEEKEMYDMIYNMRVREDAIKSVTSRRSANLATSTYRV